MILVILLSTIFTIARICMHQDNPTKKINTGKTSPPQPYSWQNKQSFFQQIYACLMHTTKNRWWDSTKNKFHLWNVQLHPGYFELWVFHSICHALGCLQEHQPTIIKHSGFHYCFDRSTNWAWQCLNLMSRRGAVL